MYKKGMIIQKVRGSEVVCFRDNIKDLRLMFDLNSLPEFTLYDISYDVTTHNAFLLFLVNSSLPKRIEVVLDMFLRETRRNLNYIKLNYVFFIEQGSHEVESIINLRNLKENVELHVREVKYYGGEGEIKFKYSVQPHINVVYESTATKVKEIWRDLLKDHLSYFGDKNE